MRLSEVGGTTLNPGRAFHPQLESWTAEKESELNAVSIALCLPIVDRGRHLGTNGPGKPYIPGVAKALKNWHLPVKFGKYTGQGYSKVKVTGKELLT